MKKIEYEAEPHQKFVRRRCPHCNSGQYGPVRGAPALRRCEHCKGTFDLELEGVVPGAKPARVKAAGSGVIAGPIEQKYRGYRWRNWVNVIPTTHTQRGGGR